jgi:hypothetical protein
MFPVFKTVVCGEGLSEIKTIDSTFDSGRMKKISEPVTLNRSADPSTGSG